MFFFPPTRFYKKKSFVEWEVGFVDDVIGLQVLREIGTGESAEFVRDGKEEGLQVGNTDRGRRVGWMPFCPSFSTKGGNRN